MRFLMRMAFWLTVILALLPSSGSQPTPTINVSALEAMSAAKATVTDMGSFCGRQPDACSVGSQAAAAIGHRAQAGAKMVLALQDTMYVNEGKRIALFAIAERLPTMFGFRENVDDGGLMSYGTNLRESFRRLASFVDKILKGEKPADLPIEFPTKLQLVINLTTAKALGLDLPPMLLAGADELIE